MREETPLLGKGSKSTATSFVSVEDGFNWVETYRLQPKGAAPKSKTSIPGWINLSLFWLLDVFPFPFFLFRKAR